MLRKIYLTIGVLFFVTSGQIFAQSGAIQGRILDREGGGPLPFANIIAEVNGTQVGGTTTDFDGKFSIKPLAPGKYNLKASFVGYGPVEISGVLVSTDKITFQDVKMSKGIDIKTVVIEKYVNPLIDKGNPSTQTTITQEEIKVAPTRDVRSVASTTAGVYQKDEGSALNVRGSRDNATDYYIDGIKVRGSTNIPQAGIEQITVVTGGVPAQYGDATGGIINITTRGPSKKYFGGIELVTSELFDKYGYFLGGINLSGPLFWKKAEDPKNRQPLAGFFLTGEFQHEDDPNPSAVGMYRVKDNVMQTLQANPLKPRSTSTVNDLSSEFLALDDYEKITFKQNIPREAIRLSGKVDFAPTTNTNIAMGGTFEREDRNDYIRTYQLFNSSNNPQRITNTYRMFGRFTQKFSSADAQAKSASSIKNAYYTVQFDYSKQQITRGSGNHDDNLFNYGYVGWFDRLRAVTYAADSLKDTSGVLVWVPFVQQNLPVDTMVLFSALGPPLPFPLLGYTYTEPLNPLLSAYTSQYYQLVGSNVANNYQTLNQIRDNRALRNGDGPSSVYSLYSNLGSPWNGYQLVDNDQYRISAFGNADIKDHAIQIGFEWEQRSDRGYLIQPVGLWTVMRSLANNKNTQMDKSFYASGFDYSTNVFSDTVKYNRLYSGGDIGFYELLRRKLGLSMTDWINIDALSPEVFSLDLLTPDELYANGNPSDILQWAFGYDYTGKKLTGKQSLEDFFNKKNDDGVLLRNVGAFEPIYMAGFIQDKFAFRDLIFNVGVRVDRFDANQSVLKDKFLLFPAKTVGEVSSLNNKTVTHPSGIGTDYIVYVNSNSNPTTIFGYRDGDQWYTNAGVPVPSFNLLNPDDPSVIVPYLVNPDKTNPRTDITSASFADYDPQVTVMPRVAFSFPISDEAMFFAHYDVLTQRPPTNLRMNPLDYLFIEGVNREVSNPGLKPEKTTDYELGFKQKLTRSSAFTLTAFYRELRDMIQIRNVNGAFPRSYVTFDNLDFGTVKGLSFAYDLRRTANVRLAASYTLQFADGTGSAEGSTRLLISQNQPNLRVANPLDFDQRHTLVTSMDYRYSSGTEYNGPIWFNKQFFANTGLNMVLRAGSGTPYTRQSNTVAEALTGIHLDRTIVGSVNGSRLPWQFRIDTKLDRDFDLKWGKEGESTKKAYLNVYVLVQNLLDARNIINVYRFTGNANDDGYIPYAAAQGFLTDGSKASPQGFADMYSIKVNNPDNFSLPRRARLGVSLNF